MAFVPNMNVLVQTPQGLPKGASFLSQAKQLMTTILRSEGFKHVTTSVVDLPLGSAVEAQCTVPSDTWRCQ